MAAKGNSNRGQKNTVRIALATAATITTLIGAQTLAFAGNSNPATQNQQQDQQTVVNTTDSQDQTDVVTPLQDRNNNQVYAAPYQPRPRSRSSR